MADQDADRDAYVAATFGIDPAAYAGLAPSSSATAVPGSPDPCGSLLERIIALLNELAQRINDALDDRWDLFNRHYSLRDADPAHGSWEGHAQRFRADREELRRTLAEWEANGCGGRRVLNSDEQADLDEAYAYKDKDYPARPANPMRTADPEPEGITATKVLEALAVLGLSVALVATIVAALADPEPVTKLGLAGLTAEEIAQLAALLGLTLRAAD